MSDDGETREYRQGETLANDEALAGCGRCGRTIVVTLDPGFRVEFHYCTDRDDCERARRERNA